MPLPGQYGSGGATGGLTSSNTRQSKVSKEGGNWRPGEAYNDSTYNSLLGGTSGGYAEAHGKSIDEAKKKLGGQGAIQRDAFSRG